MAVFFFKKRGSIRNNPPVSPDSEVWRRLYRKRGAIERLFSILKDLIFEPVAIYLMLVSGIHVALQYVALPLFTEIASFYFRPKQETFLIWFVTAIVIGETLFQGLLQAEYVRTSAMGTMFGLSNAAPDWYSPPLETGVARLRTLWHPAWD